MAALKILQHMAMASFVLVFFVACCFSSTTVSGATPYDVISGYVLDEYGNPVPGATVTLWQDGQQWQPYEMIYPGSKNPQTSGIDQSVRGVFLFGFLYPGQYTIMAEKYGYNGSASVNISNSTVHAPYSTDVILGNFDASLSREQLVYTGKIVGSVNDDDGRPMYGMDVSLWQNGSMVDMPDNPQKSGSVYQFRHLPPGQYEVKVFNGSHASPVNVSNNTVTFNIYFPKHGPPAPLTPTPSPAMPAPVTAVPVNGPGWLVILLSIGITALFYCLLSRTK